ncbi:MAG: hypothetical protein AAF657_35975, partial [Acidobacteriota bacterium]
WPRLYRLQDDLAEQHNLADKLPIRRGYLAALLRAELTGRKRPGAGEAAVIDDEIRESLRALGYLD